MVIPSLRSNNRQEGRVNKPAQMAIEGPSKGLYARP